MQNITFRTHLVGAVSDFCAVSKLAIVNPVIHLAELIVLLAHYKEEGVRLSPQVYLTNDIDKAMSMLPDGEKITIGAADTSSSGIKQALKRCAPLASETWLIYISEIRPGAIEFGLFRGSTRSIAVPVDSVLMSEGSPDLVLIKLFQIAEECIELKSNFKKSHYIFLNNREEGSDPPLKHLDSLIQAIARNAPDDTKEALTSYLFKILSSSLQASHGSLVAVSSSTKTPNFLAADGVILTHPINFVRLIAQMWDDDSSEPYLNTKSDLVKGMFASDGIVLFNNCGALLGYNCFTSIPKKNAVVGGARRRAFKTLASRVGNGLSAAFMQSQDGWTEFQGI
ncbi:hypothetical protein [Rhizobium arsenicireducens]